MTGMKRIEILRPWAIFVWLFVWQAGVLVLDQQILLVSPVRVLLRLVELAVELDFWKAVAFSTLRITAGFLLGTMATAGWGFCQTAHIGRIAGTLYASSEINSGGFVYYPCPDIIFFP